MPEYPFRCEACGPFDVMTPMSRAPRGKRACPRCGKPCERDWTRMRVRGHGEDSFKPYWSEAMGRGWINPSTPEPGIPGERYDSQGRLYVSSRSHLKRLKDRTGLVERKSYVE